MIMIRLTSGHYDYDQTHREGRRQDHCFKINPQFANVAVAPVSLHSMIKRIFLDDYYYELDCDNC